MLTIYKRGKVWWAQWRDRQGKGKSIRHQVSLRTKDKIVADAKRRELELSQVGAAYRTLYWQPFAAEFLEWITPQEESGERPPPTRQDRIASA